MNPKPKRRRMVNAREQSAKSLARTRQEAAENRKIMPRRIAYAMPSTEVGKGKVTTDTRRQADRLFDEHIAATVCCRKMQAKRLYFHELLSAGKHARWMDGTVRVSRRNTTSKAIHRQVIDAAAASGLFKEFRSPKGAPHMSRLLPLQAFDDVVEADPWSIDDSDRCQNQFVFVTDRDTGEELQMEDFADDAAIQTYQQSLELINATNSNFKITCRRRSSWDDELAERVQLRPVHFARFSRDPQREDDFLVHGRIYCGKYGHQSLRFEERQTLRFGRLPSVELDFAGLHPRLIYHLSGLPYTQDPYRLWGRSTTPVRRLLAKVAINCLINAREPKSASSAFHQAMSTKTKDGQRKSGKALRDARRLHAAYRESGVTFNDIHRRALKRHEVISSHFGSDVGIRLMRTDGKIALEIMDAFASIGVPILGVHDSFIVPFQVEDDLRQVMVAAYTTIVGFPPVIK